MSFTPARGGLDRSYDLVRQSLLQSDNLPFSDALTAEQIEQAFAAEGVSFGDAGCDADEAGSEQRGTIYTMGVTLDAEKVSGLFSREQIAAKLSAWQNHGVRAKQAGLVQRAEDWQSGSVNRRMHKPKRDPLRLTPGRWPAFSAGPSGSTSH